jgi:hypothetical protein
MGRLDDAASQHLIDSHANEVATLQAEASRERSRANALANRVAEFEGKAEMAAAIGAVKIKPPKWQAFKPGKVKPGRATAWLHMSDWHFDEVVRPELMNGLNAYNREIAVQRLRTFTDRSLVVADSLAGSYGWDGCVLSINGDMWSGWIHGLRETNDHGAGLFADLRFWAEQLAACIRSKADYYGHVVAYVTVGNHGRMSIKWDDKRPVADNVEYQIGLTLQDWFANDDRVEIHVAESTDIFFSIYDLRVCQTHGNTGAGNSGTSSVYGPWSRIERTVQNKHRIHKEPFDVATLGHFHNYRPAAAGYTGYVANGCGKGYDEYSAGKGYDVAPPVQGFTIVHPERGCIGHHAIEVSDRAAEGW